MGLLVNEPIEVAYAEPLKHISPTHDATDGVDSTNC